ncbi:uncharacterized protein [Molothrus aeneus]|uniref:uncharacterized protein n=1 Tax=Molothrus aeneus TaxID=84833 RepID=UPI003457DEC2
MTSPRPKKCDPAPHTHPKNPRAAAAEFGVKLLEISSEAMGRLCRCCRRRRGRSKGPSRGHPKSHPKGPPRAPPRAQRHPRPCSPPPAQLPRPPMTSPPTSPMTSAVPAYVILPPPALVTLGAPRVALLGEPQPQIRCF